MNKRKSGKQQTTIREANFRDTNFWTERNLRGIKRDV
jgi:hypothetical protein